MKEEQRINGLVDAYHAEGYDSTEIFLLLVNKHDVARGDAQSACCLDDDDLPSEDREVEVEVEVEHEQETAEEGKDRRNGLYGPEYTGEKF